MSARIEWLTVVGDTDLWRSLGLTVTADGLVPLHGTSLRIVASIDPGDGVNDGDEAADSGLIAWSLSGGLLDPGSDRDSMAVDPDSESDVTVASIDGLPTEVVAAHDPVFAAHALGARDLDHVVVLTNDLMRTTEAVATATGCELKRVRELGSMRQGFHRIGRGGLVVEVVERPDFEGDRAKFWGLVINVEDLDVACDVIGSDRIGPPKDAVQPGRRIATVKADVGLGVPLALMSLPTR